MKKPAMMAVPLVLTALVAGCSGGSGGSGGAQGGAIESSFPLAENTNPDGEFAWGYSAEVTSFDPHRGSSSFDNIWLSPVYDRLVYSNEVGELEPMLATEWETSEDKRTITMQLREGLTFSDGTAFNAEAAKYSLDRAREDESVVQNELTNVTDVSVDGDYTLVISVDGGAGSILGTLADRPGMMISPNVEDPNAEPTGIGPYVVSENIAGDRVTYTATEDYWDPTAQNVGTMVFRVMSDDQTRINALQSNEIQGGIVRQNQVDTMVNRGFNVLVGDSPTFFNMSVNTEMEPFDDERVRRALSMAIDREAIGDGLLGGYCTPQLQVWPESNWAYSEEIGDGLDRVPHDLEQVQSLLDDAGYGDGIEFDATVTDITGYVSVAESVQAQLEEAGITMNLRVLPPAQAREQFQAEDAVGATVSTYSPAPDPQGVMDRLILPTAASNPGEYTDDEIVELATAAADETEPEVRAGYYQQISERMLEETPSAFPICMQQRTEGFAPEVSGLEVYPSGLRDFRGVGVAD